VANTLYFRSTFAQGTVFLGTSAPTMALGPAEDYPLDTKVYYVSPCTDSPCESPQVPALKRMVLGTGASAPTMTAQLVASNIENFQVQYGVQDSAADSMQYFNASSSVDWTKVVALRIWLLARSTDNDPSYTATQSYRIGDQTISKSDGFQRQVFQQVVQVRK
jgi:type IV pilus assembly protein PilW